MVTKKICLLSLAIFFLLLINLNFIFSEGVVINIKDTFQQGDKIEFNYTIDLNLVGEIRYFYGIKCNNLPEELLDLKRVNSNGDKIIGNYIGIEVDKEYENCSAFLSVISPIKLEKRKTFSTVGIIEKEFNVDIDFCKSSDCNEKSKVFIKDEEVFLVYSSNTPGLSIEAVISLPDKTTRQTIIPGSIKADQIGIYDLEITASKQGYNTITKKEQFAVIESPAEIKSASICNVNGECDGEENMQNCPQDCTEALTKYFNNRLFLWIILSLISLIVVIIIFAIAFKLKSRDVKKSG